MIVYRLFAYCLLCTAYDSLFITHLFNVFVTDCLSHNIYHLLPFTLTYTKRVFIIKFLLLVLDLDLAIALGLGLGLAFGSVWAGIGLVLELSLVWAWVGPGRDPGLGLGLGLEPVLGLGLSLVWDLGLVLVLAWCRSVSNFGKNPGGSQAQPLFGTRTKPERKVD